MSEPARGDGLQWQSRVGARMVPGPIGHPLRGEFLRGEHRPDRIPGGRLVRLGSTD